MKGYVLAEIEVTDPEPYEEYRAVVGPTIAAYGGRFLVRGGEALGLEGNPPKRMVLLEFPSFEAARDWYHSEEYAGPKALRHLSSNGRLVLLPGVE